MRMRTRSPTSPRKMLLLIILLLAAAVAATMASAAAADGSGLRGIGGEEAGKKATKKGGSAADTATTDAASSGVFLTESFDTYPLGEAPPAPWTTTVSKGAVTVEEFQPGVKALRATTEAADGGKTAYATLTNLTLGGDQSTNKYYGRLRFYLEAAPEEKVHWTMVQGSGLVVNQVYRAVCRFGGQLPAANGSQLMSNYDTPDFYDGHGPGTDCWRQGAGATVPVGKWTCLEWLFDGSAPAEVGMAFWLGGQPVEALTVEGGRAEECVRQDGRTYTLPSPDFATRLDLGWESYNADKQARTLWIDDIRLGTERVGCP